MTPSDLAIPSATILQLCPVPPGFTTSRDSEGEPLRHVIALALIEVTVRSESSPGRVDEWTGREVVPLTVGYGDDPDTLEFELGNHPFSSEIYYAMRALGDVYYGPSIQGPP